MSKFRAERNVEPRQIANRRRISVSPNQAVLKSDEKSRKSRSPRTSLNRKPVGKNQFQRNAEPHAQGERRRQRAASLPNEKLRRKSVNAGRGLKKPPEKAANAGQAHPVDQKSPTTPERGKVLNVARGHSVGHIKNVAPSPAHTPASSRKRKGSADVFYDKIQKIPELRFRFKQTPSKAYLDELARKRVARREYYGHLVSERYREHLRQQKERQLNPAAVRRNSPKLDQRRAIHDDVEPILRHASDTSFKFDFSPKHPTSHAKDKNVNDDNHQRPGRTKSDPAIQRPEKQTAQKSKPAATLNSTTTNQKPVPTKPATTHAKKPVPANIVETHAKKPVPANMVETHAKKPVPVKDKGYAPKDAKSDKSAHLPTPHDIENSKRRMSHFSQVSNPETVDSIATSHSGGSKHHAHDARKGATQHPHNRKDHWKHASTVVPFLRLKKKEVTPDELLNRLTPLASRQEQTESEQKVVSLKTDDGKDSNQHRHAHITDASPDITPTSSMHVKNLVGPGGMKSGAEDALYYKKIYSHRRSMRLAKINDKLEAKKLKAQQETDESVRSSVAHHSESAHSVPSLAAEKAVDSGHKRAHSATSIGTASVAATEKHFSFWKKQSVQTNSQGQDKVKGQQTEKQSELEVEETHSNPKVQLNAEDLLQGLSHKDPSHSAPPIRSELKNVAEKKSFTPFARLSQKISNLFSKNDDKESGNVDAKDSDKNDPAMKESGKIDVKESEKIDVKESEKIDVKESEKIDVKESGKFDVIESGKVNVIEKESGKVNVKESGKIDVKESGEIDGKESGKIDGKESGKIDGRDAIANDAKSSGKNNPDVKIIFRQKKMKPGFK